MPPSHPFIEVSRKELKIRKRWEVNLRIYPRKYKNTEKYKIRSKREKKIEDMVRFTPK